MMTNVPITHFELDNTKLDAIRECMNNYDVGEEEAEWPNNIISRRTVIYGCGTIARQETPVRFAIDPNELALCRQLTSKIANVMAGVDVGMGSESGDPFREFFISANVDEDIPTAITDQLIRSKFGGTIFPMATITIEPFRESGIWWAEVEYDGSESEPEYFQPWRAMIQWFQNCSDFVDSAFVRIGDRKTLSHLDIAKDQFPAGTEMTGCVLPRLALGLTKHGSLVGLFGYSVQT